ncbi:maackiain detoxification [Guyanagaster necrorhizus]|uniref:Maackiain detoxification n=1 Tax=Guyanagaster necrorhizus TaxID=856835 RepID=A0A9P8AUD4_9AGAR|nr:maackiain detoxification [Guyanagaster necrorhizus MCA 3950]KAG7448145.1 maackiain detoxification [Guyanagaster necrorhizus MCA 3950]
MAENMVREPLSRIDILIAGGGLAGLTVAIECYRKGHNVRVVERRPGLDPFGDLIAIQPSALCTMRKWPGFVDQLYENQFGPDVHMYKFDGTLIGVFPSLCDYDPSTGERAVTLSRLELHRALHKYATSLGISIQHGISVEHYSETIDKGCAILADGTKLEADLVIAADGVGGKAWSIVSGKKEQPISSGYAIYRTTFPLEHAMNDPLLAKVYEGNGSHASAYIGPNSHIVTGKNKNIDNGNATEDWSKTQSSDSALKYVKDWSPFVPALINAVPNKEVVDWKLMWRNPQPKWTSPMGRVAQIGDAAHSLLPTSGSGATMAMEDGFTLAACLHVGGRNNIPLAVQVYNKLRFERVSCAQRMGFKTRESWHHTDWDAVSKNPQLVGKVIGNWLAKHDSEKYAYDNYAACAKHITEGTPFANTNTPPGYTYEPWTVEDLLKAAREKTDVQDAGDWS